MKQNIKTKSLNGETNGMGEENHSVGILEEIKKVENCRSWRPWIFHIENGGRLYVLTFDNRLEH